MIEEISFGGKIRPYSFGYKCLKHTLKEQSKTEQGLELDEVMIYWAFVVGAEHKKIKVDFKLKDIENWIEDDLDTYHQLRGEGAYHFMQFEMKDKETKLKQATEMATMLEAVGVDIEQLSTTNEKKKKKVSHLINN